MWQNQRGYAEDGPPVLNELSDGVLGLSEELANLQQAIESKTQTIQMYQTYRDPIQEAILIRTHKIP